MPAQPSIHIRQMRIRVPGTNPAVGHALVEALRTHLADLSATHPVHLGAMNLTIPSPNSAGMQTLPRAITSVLANRLTPPSSSAHA